MSSWVVIPCLLALRDEFNQLNPNRDKGADGTIGDSSHTSSSDHTPDEDSDVLRGKDSDSKNEVHALDIDSTGPWPAGRSFKAIVMDVIAGEKRKWLDPNDMCRLNYVIIDREIYDKDNDFDPQPYTGSDPHTNHAHFSARYETQAENDTRPWGVADEMSSAEVVEGNKDYDAKYRQGDSPSGVNWYGNNTGVAVWDNQYLPNPISGGKTPGYVMMRDLATQLMQVKQMLSDLSGKDFTDEAAIVQGVLAGLAGADGAAETIANAVVAALPPDLAAEVVAEMGRLLSSPPPADAQ